MDFLGSMLPLVSQFNANQTARQNAREARDWEEEMYLKYNSPSALVRQYQDAGINPALMFGGSTPAAPTDTAAAETIQPQTGTVTEMLGQLMQLDLLDAEKRIKAASARNLENEATGKEIENKYKPQLLEQSVRKGEVDIEQMRYGIAESIARINNIEAQTLNEEERGYLMKAQRILALAQATLAGKQGRLTDAQSIQREFSNKVLQDTGSEPGTSFWNLFPGFVARSDEELSKFGRWLKKQLSSEPHAPYEGFVSR